MEKNVFEQMAKRYDTEERIELAKIISTEVRKKLLDAQSKTLIDYGSGTGLVSLALTDLVDSVLLIDSSEQMLAVAKAKIAQKELNHAQVLHTDFTKKLPTVKADIVLMSLVLLHIPETKTILQNLYRILNEHGQLIIVDFDENEQVSHPLIHSGFSHEGLKQVLAEVGFISTEIETFYHGKNIFANKDASMFIACSMK